MAIALVASVKQAGEGTTSSIDTTGANFIVIQTGKYSGSALTVSDNKGNTWTGLTLNFGYAAGHQVFFCAIPTVGTGHTFTVTAPSAYPEMCVAAFSGMPFASPFEFEQVYGSTPLSTITTAPITPGQHNVLMIAACCVGNVNPVSINSSFTIIQTQNYTGGLCMGGALAYRILATPSSIQPTWTLSGVGYGSASLLSFLSAAADATTVTTAFDKTCTESSIDQSVLFTATVTGSSVISEGTVEFQLFNGAVPVGSPVTGNVVSGNVSVSYIVPGGTTAGSYTIHAEYSGTANFDPSQDDAVLTVLPLPAADDLSLSEFRQRVKIPTITFPTELPDKGKVRAEFENLYSQLRQMLVTITGIPGTGKLVKFSGPTKIEPTDLTGDVTTNGSTVTTISANAVTNEKFRQSVPHSVVGRSANSSGNVADIQSGVEGDVLTQHNNELVFRQMKDSGYWEPLANGDTASPELIFGGGDVIMVWIPGV